MKKNFFLFGFFFINIIVNGQQLASKYSMEMEYLTYKPADYDNDTLKKWPLVIFLHGAGERGDDLNKIKVHGPPMLVEQGKEFPFLLISPQAKSGWNADFLFAMIQDFVKNHRVDKDRIYLTGLSMGGYGTWNISQKYENYFAAIVPICGGGDTKDIWKLRHTPVWCFHGAKDEVVPMESSKRMVDALKPYNSDVKFTVYPEVYHDSWKKAYDDPELYEWMLSQRKYKHKKVLQSKETLVKYEGTYNFKNNGREQLITISYNEGNLIAGFGDQKITLIPSGGGIFFIQEDQSMELHFKEDKNGEVKEIVFFGNEMMHMPKVK